MLSPGSSDEETYDEKSFSIEDPYLTEEEHSTKVFDHQLCLDISEENSLGDFLLDYYESTQSVWDSIYDSIDRINQQMGNRVLIDRPVRYAVVEK